MALIDPDEPMLNTNYISKIEWSHLTTNYLGFDGITWVARLTNDTNGIVDDIKVETLPIKIEQVFDVENSQTGTHYNRFVSFSIIETEKTTYLFKKPSYSFNLIRIDHSLFSDGYLSTYYPRGLVDFDDIAPTAPEAIVKLSKKLEKNNYDMERFINTYKWIPNRLKEK